jgi:hypothetical protein
MKEKLMPSDDRSYAYKHELEFIAKLGRWSELRMDRGDLLARYMEACTRRSNWIGINKAHVFAALTRELAKL